MIAAQGFIAMFRVSEAMRKTRLDTQAIEDEDSKQDGVPALTLAMDFVGSQEHFGLCIHVRNSMFESIAAPPESVQEYEVHRTEVWGFGGVQEELWEGEESGACSSSQGQLGFLQRL